MITKHRFVEFLCTKHQREISNSLVWPFDPVVDPSNDTEVSVIADQCAVCSEVIHRFIQRLDGAEAHVNVFAHHPDQRMIYAVHEAAHAVVDRVFGLDINYVRLVPTGEDGSLFDGYVNMPLPGKQSFGEYRVALAAASAASVIYLQSTQMFVTTADRIDIAYQCQTDTAMIEQHTDVDQTPIGTVFARAASVVMSRWGAVMNVAKTLVNAGTLYQDDVDRIAGITTPVPA